MSHNQFQTALANPDAAMLAIEKEESERKLIDFMRNGWHVLEPGQPFVSGWSVEAICDHLEAVTRGDIQNLLVNVPPGCTKSMCVSVFWLAWEWGPKKMAHHRFLCGSYKVALAERDAKRARDLINSDWYQDQWGDQFEWKKDQAAKVNYQNSKTGWRISCAAASMTGERGDRVILDDPHSIEGAESDATRETTLRTFSETIPTRLNKQSESAIVVIMQRIKEDDVSGLILAEQLGYEHLMLPMEFEPERRCYSTVKPSYIENPQLETVFYDEEEHSWKKEPPEEDPHAKSELRYNVDMRTEDGELLNPVRFSRVALTQLKKVLSAWGGTSAEAGQLQQRPTPRGGGMFQKADFTIVDSVPEGGKTVRGWDLAATEGKSNKHAAFTVGAKLTIAKGGVYIEHVARKQASPSKVEKMILANVEMDGHGVLQDFPQDPGQSGKAQKFAIAKLLHGYTFVFSPESGSKEDRAKPLSAQCEGGNVHLVRGSWNAAFIKEAILFPNGRFKDQIDAASRAYANLIRKRRRLVGAAPVIVRDS